MPSAALRLHRFSRRKSTQLLALLAAVLPVTLPVAGATYIWDGNGGNGNARWSISVNWLNNSRPPAFNASGLTNSDVVFAGSFKLTPIIDSTYYLRTLIFDVSAGAFNISAQSGQSIRLGSGGIINISTNTQAFNTSLMLSNSQTWLAAVGDLDFRSTVSVGSSFLTIDGNRNVSFTGPIQGTGGVIKDGAGALVLGGTAANTFSGGMSILEGTVTVAKANALGTGPLTVSGGVLNLGNFNQSFSSITLSGGTINSGSGMLSSSSSYQLQSGTVNSLLGGSSGVMKTTAGTVTITAPSSYTGGTTISGGKFLVNNTSGSGTGTGSVLVNGSGLLAGIGFISGFVTNGPGGTISAGNEIGVLNLGSTVWFGGATDRWDISDATGGAGVGWDLLNINGTLTLNATATSKALIDITSFTLSGTPGLATNFDPTQSYLWTIAQTTGGILFQSGESELTVFDLLTGNFLNAQGGTFGVELSTDGRALNVTYTPIPEPNVAAVLGIGCCLFIYVRRFKQNWSGSRR